VLGISQSCNYVTIIYLISTLLENREVSQIYVIYNGEQAFTAIKIQLMVSCVTTSCSWYNITTRCRNPDDHRLNLKFWYLFKGTVSTP